MSLAPNVGRVLYRGLLSAASALDVELGRCESLRQPEFESLRQAVSKSVPRDLRGLFDVNPSSSNSTSNSTSGGNGSASSSLAVGDMAMREYVRLCARRVAEASGAEALRELGLDGAAGFCAARHMNARVEALRHMVYARRTSFSERHGIQVGVESEFQGADRHRYFFRYRVRISNVSADTVQLLSRAWTIRDLDGRVTSVQGPGVVGAFPTLAPNQTYEYSSGVPLQTPLGTQSGHYMFVTLLDEEGGNNQTNTNSASEVKQMNLFMNNDNKTSTDSKMLQVPIAPFSHCTPSMDVEKGGAEAGAGEQQTGEKGPSEAEAQAQTNFKSARRKRRGGGEEEGWR